MVFGDIVILVGPIPRLFGLGLAFVPLLALVRLIATRGQEPELTAPKSVPIGLTVNAAGLDIGL